MKLYVEHNTIFQYDAPVYETATELRLQPVDGSGDRQRCERFTVQVDPPAPIFHYTDFYNNVVHHFNLLRSHNQLTIKANSVVVTGIPSPFTPADDILLRDLLLETRYVRCNDAVFAFAEPLKSERIDIFAERVAGKIFETFIYEPGVTGVHSTSTEVMELGRGVCQDFAHIMLAVLRCHGVPARYVSGYLYGGPGTEEHPRASHAWCEVYGGSEMGWLGFDPTNEQLLVDERYVKIGSGRDYGDVSLVRGTFKGHATEKLQVDVHVRAAE